MAFAALFGRRKTPEEMLRQNQSALNKVIRELDRERAGLERQEKKLVVDIKKMAKSGQMEAVKIIAKEVSGSNGQCHEGCNEGPTQHEQAAEPAGAAEDHDAVRARVGDHGPQGGGHL